MRYQAYFKEYKKQKMVSLEFWIVDSLEKKDRGILAQASNPEGTHRTKFWVAKKDQPLGSRCRVYAKRGDSIPTISRDKTGFEVREGTIVLYSRPHAGSAAFPVISWDDYQNALKKLEQMPESDTTEATADRHGHRWVPAPPYHGPNGTKP
jgi:hypothetical protein